MSTAAPALAAVTRISFETQPCTRCSGTGRMPFAVKAGICFKCEGKGTSRTRRGQAAYLRFLDLQKQLCTAAASQLAVGDRIVIHTPRGRKVDTVVEVTTTLGRGNGGGTLPYAYSNLGVSLVRTARGGGYQGAAHHAVTRAWTTETLTAAGDALARMSGAIIERAA